jgi:hypothetical protein
MRSCKHDPVKAVISGGLNLATFMHALHINVVEDCGITIEDLPIGSIDEGIVQATFQEIDAVTPILTNIKLVSLKANIFCRTVTNIISDRRKDIKPLSRMAGPMSLEQLVHSHLTRRIAGVRIERALVGFRIIKYGGISLEAMAAVAHMSLSGVIRHAFLNQFRSRIGRYIRERTSTSGAPVDFPALPWGDDALFGTDCTDQQLAQLEADERDSRVCIALLAAHPESYPTYSPLQRKICVMKAAGATIKEIREETREWPVGSERLSTGPIEVALARSIQGLPWFRGVVGGRQHRC